MRLSLNSQRTHRLSPPVHQPTRQKMPKITEQLATFDPQLSKLILLEEARQSDHAELIASENYVSDNVRNTQASILTNKYAEGYPSRRYYGGCENVDIIESIAISRACELFKCEYANVQPHSGAQANAAVLFSMANPGDCLLGMNLAHGGHLTHGSPVNFSGKNYNVVHYGVDPTSEEIDYDQMQRLAHEHKPKVVIGGYSAYSRHVDWARMREIADSVGARLWVDMAHVAGLVAADLYPSPLPYAHVVTSTTHKTLRGPRGGLILSANDDSSLHRSLDSAVFPGSQGGPLMHVIAAKAVAFKEALSPSFREYQRQVLENARAMASVITSRGYRIVSGGTDNHMIIISLGERAFSGKVADEALGRAGITVNKNMIPFDRRPPTLTSGIRIGTPAVTTRGFGVSESSLLAGLLCDVLDSLATGDSEGVITTVKERVTEMCSPLPTTPRTC